MAFYNITAKTPSGKNFVLEVQASWFPNDVRDAIYAQDELFPPHTQKLIVAGKAMDEHETLADAHIDSGDTIFLVSIIGGSAAAVEATNEASAGVQARAAAAAAAATAAAAAATTAAAAAQAMSQAPGSSFYNPNPGGVAPPTNMVVGVAPGMGGGVSGGMPGMVQSPMPQHMAPQYGGVSPMGGGGGYLPPGQSQGGYMPPGSAVAPPKNNYNPGAHQSSSSSHYPSSGSSAPPGQAPLNRMKVTIPQGVYGGQSLRVNAPGHGQMEVTVPQGMGPGMTFEFQLPAGVMPLQAPSTVVSVTVPAGVAGGQAIRIQVPGKGLMQVVVPVGMVAGNTFQVRT
jgi:hypothetical protein